MNSEDSATTIVIQPTATPLNTNRVRIRAHNNIRTPRQLKDGTVFYPISGRQAFLSCVEPSNYTKAMHQS